MKFVIISLLLLITISSTQAYEKVSNIHTREYYEEKFYDYLEARPHLKPKDSVEFVHWLDNFAHNDDIIEYTNAKGLSYKFGHNDLSILSQEEFREKYKLDKNAEIRASRKRDGRILNVTEGRGVTYSSYKDWVNEGYVNPVEDQGYCGSCWAFASVGVLESLEAITYGKNYLKVYSKQQVISCDTYNSGCEGGLTVNSWYWLKNSYYERGMEMCSSSSYPYTESNSVCKFDTYCSQKYSTAIPSRVVMGVENKDEELLSMTYYNPVAVAINADALQLYQSGIFSDTSCSNDVNHEVINVGYGTSNGVDYWKVRNSWGTSWGENGYIRMRRYGNPSSGPYNGICGILSDINDVYI